jgi:Yip1 domain
MTFLKRLIWIFTSPNRVFDDIRERRVGWAQPWLLSSLFYMVITWMAMPVQRAVLEVHPTMSTEQIGQQIEFMDRFGFMWIIMAPVGALLITLVIAGLTYVAVTLASRAATFKQYLSLSFFCGIIGMAGQLIAAIVLRMRGLERIASPEDAHWSLSLRALAPDAGPVIRGALSGVEFFAIWSLVVLAMGLRRIFGMSRGAAIGVAVLLWVLFVAAMMVSEAVGGMAG